MTSQNGNTLQHETLENNEIGDNQESLMSDITALENMLAMLGTTDGPDKLKHIFSNKKSKD